MTQILRLPARAEKQERELPRTRLTKRIVEAIVADPERPIQRRDSELKGFGVRVMPTGVRTYFVQYRNRSGRTRRFALGRHGVLTAEGARALAVQRLAEAARGEDPSADRKAERTKAKQIRTVAQLVDRFLTEHVEPKRKERTAQQYQRLLEKRVLPSIGRTPVDAVSREHIEALHLQMRNTPYEANRTLAVLSKMFNMAERWGLRPLQSNPCYRLERYPERERDRFYADSELKQIGKALREAEQARTVADGAIAALRLLAFTGCRASEILGLRWADVDLDAGVLRLPDAKAGARNVPLGQPAIELLRALPRQGALVVSGRKRRTGLTLAALEKSWQKIRDAAGLKDARLHDLRHTVGTFAGQAGLNAFTVRDILGHKTLAMTNRYVSQDTSPLRRAADQVAGRIANSLAGTVPQDERWGDNRSPRTDAESDPSSAFAPE